jgi:RNA polymerase sigma-70 factor, ECF subfamily
MMRMGQTHVSWCERLYEAKAAGLVLYGRALGLSHWEAEDVLQSTFQSLLRMEAAPRLLERYCLRAYRNRALNYRRSLWRRVMREFESKKWFDRRSGETERERACMLCLANLPPEQREVIVLKIWHGHTFEEIADLLGLSPNTVAGRYRYGIQKIRVKMEAFNNENLDRFGTTDALVEAAPSDTPT